jgi:hypothetical protein
MLPSLANRPGWISLLLPNCLRFHQTEPSLLDSIFGGPGYGAMVFYLSFILSPVTGVVGGLLGARIAKEQAPSDTDQKATDEAAGPK